MLTSRFMLVITVLATILACCGGGGSSNNETATGVFMDSPVAGMQYVSGSQSGITDTNGQFTYEAGLPVKFSIGSIKLPTVAGGPLVTPLSIFGAETFNDTRVINLARLLQTLDSDHNPTNGITISASVLEAAANVNLTDFASDDFDTKVGAVVTSSGATRLVSKIDAMTHLFGQSPEGTWYGVLPNPEQMELNIILPDGTFLNGTYAPNYPETSAAVVGIQRVSVSWNPTTGLVSFGDNFETNTAHGWGVYDEVVGKDVKKSITWQPTGPNTGTATISPTGETITLTRLTTDANNPLIGTWVNINTATAEYNVFIVLPDNFYMFITDRPADADGTPGLEYGTYTFTQSNGTFAVTPLPGETNGNWGISPLYTQATITITGASMDLLIGSVHKTYQRLEP